MCISAEQRAWHNFMSQNAVMQFVANVCNKYTRGPIVLHFVDVCCLKVSDKQTHLSFAFRTLNVVVDIAMYDLSDFYWVWFVLLVSFSSPNYICILVTTNIILSICFTSILIYAHLIFWKYTYVRFHTCVYLEFRK